MENHPASSSKALIFVVSAFILWGLLPLYWKALDAVPAPVILCQRIVWSAIFIFVLIIVFKKLPLLLTIIKNRKIVLRLGVSSLILCCNWLLYIWAVNNGHIIEASLGYFITPLVSVCFGVFLFGDRPSRLQKIAVGLAAFGVSLQFVLQSSFPFIAMGLGISFSVYGAARKKINQDSMACLFIETALVVPLALGFQFFYSPYTTSTLFFEMPKLLMLFIGCGIVTAVPLVLYGIAVQQLRLTTIGLLQYTSPTISFLIGIFFFKEQLTLPMLVTFTFIWIAIFLYSYDSIKAAHLLYRKTHPSPPKRA